MKLIIGGKEYEARATMYQLERINKKFDMDTMTTWPDSLWHKYNYECAFRFLVPTRLKIFKPFLTKRSLKKHLFATEMKTLIETMTKLVSGMDDKTGN